MQLYSAHIYEANSSLLLNLEPRIVIYYVIASSRHVLASSLELWLSRYDDLLYFARIVRWANKSIVCIRNNTPHSNPTLASFSTMLLWSQNIFKRIIEPCASRDIVIFRFKIFTQSMQYQRQSYWQCQPLNIVVSSAKTPSYTIQWHVDAANCNDNCRTWLHDHRKCENQQKMSIKTSF